MQSQFLEDFFGVARELFVLLVGVLRTREIYQFHFLKLVLANDAAHIFAVRSGFAAKAWRVGSERNRQARLIQNFIAIKVRDRNFCSRNQPQIFFAMRHAEKIGGKLGQLSGAVHRIRIHQIRRQNLGVSMLARMQIEHEVRQRAFELRAQSPSKQRSARQ